MRTRKTWREKMENPDLPKLVPAPPYLHKKDGVMLIPSPREVDAFVRTVRKGRVVTLSQVREQLARKYSADLTCPLVTGIFLHIAAEVADEDAAAGKKRVTPYWRVVRDDGSLNPKFPGGVSRQEERLRDEGHRIVAGNGKRPPRVVLS